MSFGDSRRVDMHETIRKSCAAIGVLFVWLEASCGLVDTEGNAATNQTLLGDIDMGVGTLGDLSTFIAPYYWPVSNAAMTAESKIAIESQNSTNFTMFAMGKFAETGTVANATYATDAERAGDASTAGTANLLASKDDWAEQYDATDLIRESTNAANHSVSELARTNSVLSGGPYLTEHQSLEPSTNYTDYVVIELARTNSVLANGPYVQSAGMTNTVRDIVTNTVTIGYTDWVYSGNVTAGTTYTINVTESGADYVFTLYNPSEIGAVTTNVLHPTRLDFTGVGIITDVQALETKIDTMDTSYYRVVGITNKNQSVQFVETDANTTSLQILMPESGMTKDWLVYVKALTNLTLVLPPADYWVVNESVTNEIPPLVPTALYFSQISDNTYSIGRQELIPITVLSQREIENQLIRAKMRKARRLSK